MAKGFEASLPLSPQKYQVQTERSFRFAQNALEKAAANKMLTTILVAIATTGVITVERGIAYSTPGYGQAERLTDWGLLLKLFHQEPEFSRAKEAEILGLRHLFEINLSNLYEISIDWEEIKNLPGVKKLTTKNFGLTVIFTDEVLPRVKAKQATPAGRKAETGFLPAAGFDQIRKPFASTNQKDLTFVISTVIADNEGRITNQESPDDLERLLLHELGHLIHELSSEEERNQILDGSDWRDDPEGEIEGFAKTYAQRFSPGLAALKAESLSSPTFTEEEVTAVRNHLLHTLHWEAVRRDLLKEPKNPPHFKPGIEK